MSLCSVWADAACRGRAASAADEVSMMAGAERNLVVSAPASGGAEAEQLRSDSEEPIPNMRGRSFLAQRLKKLGVM